MTFKAPSANSIIVLSSDQFDIPISWGGILTRLAERIGITLTNLSILKTNKARAVRFSTLEALCRELKCQPGDLLEYVDLPANQSTVHETV